MTTYAWPSGREWLPQTCTEPELVPNVREFVGPYGGGWSAVDLLGETYRQTVRLGPLLGAAKAGERAAFFNRLRGAHLISVHALARPQPIGTQRGAPTLAFAASQGASSFTVAGATVGATWYAGDVFGVGGEWFTVADSITFASGNNTVNVCNRVRSASGIAASSVLTWDKPTTTWRVANLVQVLRIPGQLAEGVDIQLVQTFAV